MTDDHHNRREFMKAAAFAGGALAAGAGAGMAHGADMAGHSGMVGHAMADGYMVQSSLVDHCATCEFWGGQRRISQDGTSITTTGLGYCNNPASPNSQKMTPPDHGPMTGVWRKWGAIKG